MMLVGLPAFLLVVPVLLAVAGLDYAGNRAYRGKSIAASWDVRLDGEDHVVSLPATRVSSPDHAWVDGARIPLVWTEDGVWSARAALDGGTFGGTLSRGFDRREVAATVGLGAASVLLGGGTVVGLGALLYPRGRGCDRRGHPRRRGGTPVLDGATGQRCPQAESPSSRLARVAGSAPGAKDPKGGRDPGLRIVAAHVDRATGIA